MKKRKDAGTKTVSRDMLRKVHQYLLTEGGKALLKGPHIQALLAYLEVGPEGDILRQAMVPGPLDAYFVSPEAYKVYLDYISNLLQTGSKERTAFEANSGFAPNVIMEMATGYDPVVKANPLTGRPESTTEKCLYINLHVREGMVSVSHVVSEGPPRSCYPGILPDEEILPLEERNSNVQPVFLRTMPTSQLH